MRAETFTHDVFLSHSAKDKAVVWPSDSLSATTGERARVRYRSAHVAKRLRKNGLKVWPVPPKPPGVGGFDEWEIKPGDSIPAKIEEGLEHSRVLASPAVAPGRRRMLCMSANAFGSDWAQLACPAVAWQRRRKAGMFRFRDLLNKKRRFIPLRQHKHPVKARCIRRRRINKWHLPIRRQRGPEQVDPVGLWQLGLELHLIEQTRRGAP